jgi:Fe-S cluster assembly protein SufD
MTTTSATFDPAVARALPGPDWLRDRRSAAVERAAALELPTTDEEVWRYSRIDELDLEAFTWPSAEMLTEAPAGIADVPPDARALVDAVADRAGSVIVANGRVVQVELDGVWAGRGVTLGRLADLTDGDRLLAASLVSAGGAPDLFGALTQAFSDPVALVVPPRVHVDQPFVVVDWNDAEAAVSFPHLMVSLGEDAEARVVEHHAGADVAALVLPLIDLDVGPAARLGYLNVQQRGSRTWQIASQQSRVERQATLVAAQAALGGDYARTRADCRLVGRGATGNLLAVYFGEGSQTLDFRTFQDHAAPDTTSNLLFKGAVGGHSRSVYTGLIRVRPEGRGTNAFQTNRTIKLSDHAWAESVPNLEIENNDVHCSHASAVGPIDEEQRFYLESRGVPPEVAERLLVAGFFDEVLDQLPVPDVITPLRAGVAERLERRLAERRLAEGRQP